MCRHLSKCSSWICASRDVLTELTESLHFGDSSTNWADRADDTIKVYKKAILFTGACRVWTLSILWILSSKDIKNKRQKKIKE